MVTGIKSFKEWFKGNEEQYTIIGGSYVKDTKDAHEKYNFKPEHLKLKGFPEGEYCLGFVETKSTSAGKRNQLNIEKIESCSDLKMIQKLMMCGLCTVHYIRTLLMRK